mmetsp:Transcript_74180/g.141274  ORF Transcript_74180/g.141274 Transcript_74180/m.141274 type:complete len:1080 (-) Transcript_74180:46-3285(-)
MIELCNVASAVAATAFLATAAAVEEERLKAEWIDLTIGGDWWFDELYGMPHHWTSSISPLMVEGSRFAALPRTPYFIIMLFSPWWVHCRHATSEFDRLAEALHARGAEDEVQAVSLDCSSMLMRGICARFLGDPRPVAPVWQDGMNSPGINRLAFRTFADLWPASSLPTLIFASRENLLQLGSGTEGYIADADIARISPAPRLAEDMLKWVLRLGMQPLAKYSLNELLPTARDAYHKEMWTLRQSVGNLGAEHLHDETVQGCMCRPTWRHCVHTPWGMSHPDTNACHMKMGCPAELRFCKTVAPCGENQEMTDRCEPPALGGEPQVASDDPLHKHLLARHADEEDSIAALALWLHEIFSRHAFEIHVDDPLQSRRFAFARFVQLLCSYFPDHLAMWDSLHVPGAANIPGETYKDEQGADGGCRESLCRLGGILETDHLWEKYTEVVEVALEQLPKEGRSPDSGEKPPVPLLRQRVKVRRFRWHLLELDWRLCNRPWIDYGKRGWLGCQSENPLARGFPCGVWNMLHAVTAEIAQLHDCAYAAVKDVDQCIGPAVNVTEVELMQLEIARQQEKGEHVAHLLEEKIKNATLPDTLLLGPSNEKNNLEGEKCWKVIAPNKFLNYSIAVNITAELKMKRLMHNDVVKCILTKFGDEIVHEEVAIQFVNDFRRHDGGALVARVASGPLWFHRVAKEFWKVKDIGGVFIRALDWRKVLKDAYGKTTIILEGPVECKDEEGNEDELCKKHVPCAVFKFEEDPATSATDSPMGLLREQRTGLCFGHWKERSWIFWWKDLGIGLVDCNGATPYRYQKRHELQNVRFCNVEYPEDCNRPLYQMKFEHRLWVPISKVPPEVPAVVTKARDAIDRIRLMIGLFWRCQECRKRFLSFEYDAVKEIHHPRDAVLWIWKVHNEINFQLKTAADHADISPLDKNHPKSLWPPRSICPLCYKHDGNASKKGESDDWSAMFNHHYVYHFITGHFYLSSTRLRERQQKQAVPQQAWTPLPSSFNQAPRRGPKPGLLVIAVAFITFAATISALALRPERNSRVACSSGDAFSARELRNVGAPAAAASDVYMPCSTSTAT